MELCVGHLVGFIVRKKILLNLTYLLGTIAFVVFSCQTAAPSSPSVISRLDSVAPACGNHPDLPRSSLSSLIVRSEMLHHLGFVLRPHSFFYCSVPKVATRTILTFLTYLHIRDELLPSSLNSTVASSTLFKAGDLSRLLPPSTSGDDRVLLSSFLNYLSHLNEGNASQVDLWLIYQKQALPLLRLRSLSDPSILFAPSFTRAILVRHPLDRLLSAYIDKITSLQARPFSHYDQLRRSICRHFASPVEQEFYRRHPGLTHQLNEPCEKKIPTFAHFVEYLTSDPSQNDVHWYPYSSLCHVCLLKYNFIGKYETIDEDLRSLISNLGLNAGEWNRNNPYSTRRKKDHDRALYAQLSDRAYCFLKSFYREDFRLFDYRLEDYFDVQRRSNNCSGEHFRSFRKLI